MKAIVFCLVAFLFGQSEAAKEASAMCILNQQTDNIEMTFVLDMDTEPQGILKPIDQAGYLQNPKNYTRMENCDSSYSNKIYQISSKISNTNGLQQTVNPCEVVELIDAVKGEYYQWKFLQTNDDDEFISEPDRLYVVNCYLNDIQSNVLTAEVVVLNPNLQQTVDISDFNVILEVLTKNTAGVYGPSPGTANAGDDFRLRLTLTRPVPFNDNVDVFGVYGFGTYVGPDSTFPTGVATDLYIDKNGCPYTGITGTTVGNNDRIPPKAMSQGYIGAPSSDNIKYYSTTGESMLPKYPGNPTSIRANRDNPRTVYFKTYYVPFYKDQENNLDDPCNYLNGVTGRKRRSSTPEYRTVTTSITIVDPENQEPHPNTSDAADYNMVAIIVGAVVGTTLVMIIAGVICIVAVLKQERRRPKRLDESRTSSALSVVIDEKK